MKKLILLSMLSMLLIFKIAVAADMQLQIALPDVTLMLPPVSPPQLQQEGVPLISERALAEELLNFIGNGLNQDALEYFREREGETLELLETGDPEETLKGRAVVGGIMPSTRNNQISAAMLYLIGHVYFSLQNYDAAETAFTSALTPVPDYIRVHESLGLLYLQTQRYQEAQEHLAHVAQLGLHTASLFGALGYLNYQLENYWGAMNAFQEALMLNAGEVNWQQGLLSSLSLTYQHQSTMTLAETLLKDYPDDQGLWLYRGHAALQAGEKEVALSSLETAIRLGNDDVSNLQVCATLHMEIGSIARAVELLAIGFTEGMEFVFIDQGMSWLRQQEQWDFLEQMVVNARNSWEELDDLQRSKVLMREADIELNEGDEEASITALEQAINLDPSNGYALLLLASIHRSNGNFTRAELLYQRGSAFDQYRENALISLAQLALDQGDYERALQLLRNTLQEFPGRTDLNRNIDSLENLVQLQTGN